MKQFNKTNKCPKCGSSAKVYYDPTDDLMERTCFECGYAWQEYPLLKSKSKKQSRWSRFLDDMLGDFGSTN